MDERKGSRHVERIKVSEVKFDQMFENIWKLSIPKTTSLIHLLGEHFKSSLI